MWKYFYLIEIQYLGYRFHGWAKQPAVKTIHEMVDKTFRFALPGMRFKTLGSSRTDAMVSANQSIFELFLDEEIDQEELLESLNSNFPPDIRVISISEVDSNFNIIQSPKTKDYVYLFAFGEKAHPFSAPFVYTFQEELDIELMQEGAQLFEGLHNFKNFCTKPKENSVYEREITHSRIERNSVLSADFFPENTWAFHIQSKGFLRNQVRMMMGQLYKLGKGDLSLEELKESLLGKPRPHFEYIAPASGLLLYKIDIKKSH
jgi:tRNA pseudouridine38-40 synthase